MPTPHTNLFVEGLDPTGLPAFGASEALQMIREAIPSLTHGLVYYSATAPDFLANPEYARFVWVNPTTGEFKYWTGTTWVQFTLAIGSLSGAIITPGTLPLTAINLTGASVSKVLQVDATGTALFWASPLNLYASGTFPVAKLVPGASDGMFLRMAGGAVAWAWLTSAEIISTIALHSLPLNRLYTTGAANGNVPAYDAAAGYPKWVDINTLVTVPTALPTIPTLKIFNYTGAAQTWTVPAGITKARFKLWGAGGGGEYGSTTNGGGGGSGAYVEFTAAVTPASVYSMTVGKGGDGGVFVGLTHATAGGLTSITVGAFTATANGGAGGLNESPGAGGSVVGGLTDALEIYGMNAEIGTTNADSGSGGSAPQGGGGGRYTGSNVAGVGMVPGGGGGGNVSGFNGGVGGHGRILIEY